MLIRAPCRPGLAGVEQGEGDADQQSVVEHARLVRGHRVRWIGLAKDAWPEPCAGRALEGQAGSGLVAVPGPRVAEACPL
jgi:hypothetical protein